MEKSKKVEKVISDWISFEATSPWDGMARFDQYIVGVHKYDDENLALMERSDERYDRAVEEIFHQIDSTNWDQLLKDYQ